MKNIEIAMCAAVNSRTNWKTGNTAIVVEGNNLRVFLHKHNIYRIFKGRTYINLCGWNSVTTRSRLRALGVPVTTKAGKPFLNGKEIKTSGTYQI